MARIDRRGPLSHVVAIGPGDLLSLDQRHDDVSSVDASADFRSDTPRVLFDATRYEGTFGVSPDGKRLLMMPLLAPEAAPTEVHLVLNWVDELRQLVR
jgi:hypothetical protein